jgi:GTPase
LLDILKNIYFLSKENILLERIFNINKIKKMIELNKEDILAKFKSESIQKKVWYIAIIGRPNVGKSTFVNALIWEKVSIISSVPQTTRKRVLGIFNDEDSQIIFFDTPGIHKEEKIFNEEINKQAMSSMKEASLIVYFVDPTRETWAEEKYIEELLSFTSVPVLKVFTKADINKKVLDTSTHLNISSTTKEGFEELLGKMKSYLPVWNLLYDEDYYTVQEMDFRIAEIIREKVFLHTKEEIPHSIFIYVTDIEDKPSILRINAYIYTETDSQRYIIIGKNWDLVTQIWTEARIELEEIFGKKVFLALRVKTQEKWRKNERLIKQILR